MAEIADVAICLAPVFWFVNLFGARLTHLFAIIEIQRWRRSIIWSERKSDKGANFQRPAFSASLFLASIFIRELVGGSPHGMWGGFTESYIRQLFVDATREMC
jgi:hypothetical protein